MRTRMTARPRFCGIASRKISAATAGPSRSKFLETADGARRNRRAMVFGPRRRRRRPAGMIGRACIAARPADCRPARRRRRASRAPSALASKASKRCALPLLPVARLLVRQRAVCRASAARHRRDSAGRSRTGDADSAPRSRLRRAAASRPGSKRRPHRLHLLADRIGEPPGGRRRRLPPPLREMKLQVTASLRPRAAAARRTLRSIICSGVAVGRATPARAAAASKAPCRSPSIRTTSSTRSAGAVDVATPAAARATRQARPRQRRSRGARGFRCCRSLGNFDAAERARAGRDRSRRLVAPIGGAPARTTLRGLAAGNARSHQPSRAASPSSRKAGSTPRSKRLRASRVEAELLAGQRDVLGVEIGAFDAAMSVVASVTPECSPPMMPPISWTAASSAITVIVGSSV